MSNKKKRYPKSYITIGSNKICVDDLLKAVNDSDKDYGIKLKHPDVWADPGNYCNIAEANADMNIAALICIVNGIPVEDYFEVDSEYGTVCKPIGIRYAEFSDMSILDWFDVKTTYNTDSLIFRCRFLTLVLTRMMGRITKITEQEVIKNKKAFLHSKDEQRIVLLKEIMDDVITFINVMVTPDEKYQNIILKMQEHLSYSRKRGEQYELKNILNGHILQTRDNMKVEPFTERFMEDDMAIYQILKIAYMASTNKTNVKALPKFKYIEHATVNHDLSKLIEELGSKVILNTKGKYSPMFKAFIDARPAVWSQLHESTTQNHNMRMGILSLEYTKFIFNDRTMSKFIDEMKKPGM